MPGPTQHLTLTGVAIDGVVPIIPLAPGTPLAVGALSWGGRLGVGLATSGAALDARDLTDAMAVVLDELAGGSAQVVELPRATVQLPQQEPAQVTVDPKQSARNILARESGESS
jgi:hypothetical protein